MLPIFNASGVLPPFLADSPTNVYAAAPYDISLIDFVKSYSFTSERIKLLKGFLEYRKQLKECGLEKGVQWIDGSFLEDIENNKNRPPNDIDLVTIIMRPEQFSKDHLWKDFIGGKIELFNPSITKANYNCDAYLVDFCLPFDYVLRQITYWHGLFSHQRVTKIWKGILQIDLAHDEEESLRFVNNLGVDNA